MKNVIFVHGRPSKRESFLIKSIGLKYSTFSWARWLEKQLKKHGYEFNAPDMPKAYDPKWHLWVEKVEKFKIGTGTILVGHFTLTDMKTRKFPELLEECLKTGVK